VNAAICHDAARCRFYTQVDGQLCVLDYTLRGLTMTITHTGVPAAVGGRGIAAQLMSTALDAARRQGWRVLPVCSYACAYMRRHPDTADLLT